MGVPPLPNRFVGRGELVERVVTRLLSGEIHALSIEGLPGVGKSALAVVLAHHKEVLAQFEDGVLWAGLGTEPDVMRDLAIWGEALGQDVSDKVSEAARSQAVKAAIRQRRMLLVVDDAWSLEAAEALRCGGPHCVHLLTTRDKEIAQAFAGAGQMLTVPELEVDPSLNLLRALAPEASEGHPNAVRELAEVVGRLPLALELVGGYLAAPERSYFPDLSESALADLADPEKRLELAQKRLGAHGERKVTLQEAIALSLEGLPEEGQRAFYALGAFAPKPENFDRPAAEAVSGADARTLALLAARNLVEIDIDTKRLALHQTLADVARTKLDPDSVTRHRDHHLALVNEDPKDWRRIEAIYGQIKHAWTGVSKTGGEELLDMIRALRIFQQRRGLWGDYLTWAERGLSLAEEKGRRKDVGTLLSYIGNAYTHLGQREQALEYFERALPITKEVGDLAGEAATLNNIGAAYNAPGQREQALEYYKRALRIIEEAGDRGWQAGTLNNIGLVYDNLGQREQALEYFERALPIREQIGDRAGVATTLSSIGLVYANLGQWERALEYHERALPILEEVGYRAGEAVTLSHIGSVYANLEQREQALEYYEQALPILEELGDRASERTTRSNMAVICRKQDQLAEAVVELKKVVELDQLIEHPDLESDRAMLAQIEEELAGQRKKRRND